MNEPLLSRSYRSDGWLLKGDRPAFSLDVSFVYRAFGAGTGPDAKQITHTFTRLNMDMYHVVLVAEESHAYELSLQDLNAMAPTYAAFYYHNGTVSTPSVPLMEVTRTTPLTLEPNVMKDTFTVWYLSPILRNGLVMLGETSKWVPVSRGRVSWFTEGEDYVMMGLIGGPMETVTWSWGMGQAGGKWMVMEVKCTLNEEGRARLAIMADMTTQCSTM